jgi:lipid A 4'-phosphatase
MWHPYPLTFSKGIITPLILWIIFTPWSGWLDLKTSQFFFENGSFLSNPIWDWLYIYGLWPAWVMVGLSFACFAISFFNSYHSWRKPSLYLLITLAVGAGLIIHAGLKDHWGRPRPRQITEFGGQQHFHSYYQPNFGDQAELSKSFASGHASMGFYFFALALLGSVYRSRFFYWLGFGLAWGLGSLLSLTRIAQGGHFISDTLASALIMWLTAWGLAYFLLIRKGNKRERIDS